jgi:hypothetical protein
VTRAAGFLLPGRIVESGIFLTPVVQGPALAPIALLLKLATTTPQERDLLEERRAAECCRIRRELDLERILLDRPTPVTEPSSEARIDAE